MKTEKEIRKEIKILKELIEEGRKLQPSNAFIRCNTGIEALKRVLEDDGKE